MLAHKRHNAIGEAIRLQDTESAHLNRESPKQRKNFNDFDNHHELSNAGHEDQPLGSSPPRWLKTYSGAIISTPHISYVYQDSKWVGKCAIHNCEIRDVHLNPWKGIDLLLAILCVIPISNYQSTWYKSLLSISPSGRLISSRLQILKNEILATEFGDSSCILKCTTYVCAERGKGEGGNLASNFKSQWDEIADNLADAEILGPIAQHNRDVYANASCASEMLCMNYCRLDRHPQVPYSICNAFSSSVPDMSLVVQDVLDWRLLVDGKGRSYVFWPTAPR